MSGLVDGTTAPWDFVAKQHHRDDLVRHTTGIHAASRPTPRPTPPPRPDSLPNPTVPSIQAPTVLEQTRLIARAGMAARDLGHAIANNLRQLHQEDR